MNTKQQAYIRGFVKRASEYGLDQNEAIELLKSSGDLGSSPAPAPPAAKPGFLSGLFNKLPGAPTTVGSSASSVDAMADKFKEMAGG